MCPRGRVAAIHHRLKTHRTAPADCVRPMNRISRGSLRWPYRNMLRPRVNRGAESLLGIREHFFDVALGYLAFADNTPNVAVQIHNRGRNPGPGVPAVEDQR